MICKKCGRQIPSGSKVCPYCAAPVIRTTANGEYVKKASVSHNKPKTTVCPFCKREVVDDDFCPKCSKPLHPKWYQKNSPLTVVIMILALVFLIACIWLVFGGRSNNNSSQSKVDILVVNASDVLAEYEANEVAADSKYKGKVLEFSGAVEDIGKDILDTTYITISDGKEFSTSHIQCFFKDGDEIVTVASLKKGQSVTVRGICTGFSVLSLTLDNCCIKVN